jgi:hypothetical protein
VDNHDARDTARRARRVCGEFQFTRRPESETSHCSASASGMSGGVRTGLAVRHSVAPASSRPVRCDTDDHCKTSCKPRAQAGSLPRVLQPASLSHRTGWTHASSEKQCPFTSDRTPRFISLAPTLQRPLSDPGWCLIGIRHRHVPSASALGRWQARA